MLPKSFIYWYAFYTIISSLNECHSLQALAGSLMNSLVVSLTGFVIVIFRHQHLQEHIEHKEIQTYVNDYQYFVTFLPFKNVYI